MGSKLPFSYETPAGDHWNALFVLFSFGESLLRRKKTVFVTIFEFSQKAQIVFDNINVKKNSKFCNVTITFENFQNGSAAVSRTVVFFEDVIREMVICISKLSVSELIDI